MTNWSYNQYDFKIVFLISLLCFGGIGGVLSPIRIVALVYSFYVWTNIKLLQSKETKLVLCFFTVWYVYSLFSLIWTSSMSEAIKELFYYYCHFALFLLLIIWSKKANYALLSIMIGWSVFFMLSLPIALNEILNNVHLASSLHGDLNVNLGQGRIVNKKYAAVTFGNYNTYVTILCYSTPFIIALLLSVKRLWKQLLGWLAILALAYILITNASRGGLIAFLIIFFIFLFYYRKIHFNHKKTFCFFLASSVTIILIANIENLFTQILYRIGEDSLMDATNDSSRSLLITNSLQLFTNSMFIGTGIGSIVASLKTISPDFTIPHNLFIELFVQYGFVIFSFFLFFLYRLYAKAKKTNNIIKKFVIYSSLISLPFVGVINSGYLLAPELWVYCASLLIFSIND